MFFIILKNFSTIESEKTTGRVTRNRMKWIKSAIASHIFRIKRLIKRKYAVAPKYARIIIKSRIWPPPTVIPKRKETADAVSQKSRSLKKTAKRRCRRSRGTRMRSYAKARRTPSARDMSACQA